MPTELGLAEFVNQIKAELIKGDATGDGQLPLLMLDEVEIEAQVTVSAEGKGGVNIQVVQLGAGVKREGIHTVRLHLSPLLSRDERLDELRKSGHWDSIVKQQVYATTKGDADPRSERRS